MLNKYKYTLKSALTTIANTQTLTENLNSKSKDIIKKFLTSTNDKYCLTTRFKSYIN